VCKVRRARTTRIVRASSFFNMDTPMSQPTLKQTLAQIDHWIRSGAASRDVETLAHETLLRASKHIPPAALRRVIVMLEKLRDLSEQTAAAPKAQSRSGRKSAAKVVRSAVSAVKAAKTPAKAAPATKAAKAAKKRAGAPARTADSKRAKNAAVQKAVVKQAAAKKSVTNKSAAASTSATKAPAKAARSTRAGTSAAKATARVRAVRQPVAAKGR
jgi:hypothetical protein